MTTQRFRGREATSLDVLLQSPTHLPGIIAQLDYFQYLPIIRFFPAKHHPVELSGNVTENHKKRRATMPIPRLPKTDERRPGESCTNGVLQAFDIPKRDRIVVTLPEHSLRLPFRHKNSFPWENGILIVVALPEKATNHHHPRPSRYASPVMMMILYAWSSPWFHGSPLFLLYYLVALWLWCGDIPRSLRLLLILIILRCLRIDSVQIAGGPSISKIPERRLFTWHTFFSKRTVPNSQPQSRLLSLSCHIAISP